ncbi:MoxR family ATPase [Paenibacillus sp.]|uniref:AAA family ATPase n=1 Tax=Paenibacillus sp. TaxID=58172 RepID=UPI002D649A84|nr:MoxR family ATPase [Paenibacillus sp.]HZG56293.1 MoxR family ATPase [Paenibacillus sp.]
MNAPELNEFVARVRENIARVVVGKEETVELLLAALLANGHALLEDVPGTGKTLLAKTLARSLGCDFKRIQFTPDLLPSDVSGINFYNQKTGEFEFRPGPLFTNILLADEINRATPRTQSSLLECMEERQVTIDGTTHKLSAPFLVVATQNPVDNHGTFPLPEAQLDRFLMRVPVGYPSRQESVAMLERFRASNPLDELEPVASAADIVAAQRFAQSVRVSEDLLDYIVRLSEATRADADVLLGASPRASQALLRASQALAAIRGRAYVSPDDVKAAAVPVLSHRLLTRHAARTRDAGGADVVRRLLQQVEVPAEPAPRS